MYYKFPTTKVSNWPWKLVVPSPLRQEVLKECHDLATAAHLGVKKTVDRVFTKYYWPNVSQDVKEYVQRCKVCKMSKSGNQKPHGLMGKFREAPQPWQLISADILGPFPRSRHGNTCLLIVSDWFTKYPCIFTLRSAPAKKVIEVLEKEVFLQYGIPQAVIMDNGPQFGRSNKMKSLLKKYGIAKTWNNCFYHPQSNFTERHNKNVGNALRSYIDENHRTWDEFIPEITVALRTAVHAVTGYSPFFLNFGREFVLDGTDYDLSEVAGSEASSPLDPYSKRTQFLKHFHDISDQINVKMLSAYKRNKKYYDAHRSKLNLEVGDTVYRRNYVKSNKARAFNAKLAPKFIPAVITKKLSEIAFELNDLNGTPIGKWHIQDLKK